MKEAETKVQGIVKVKAGDINPDRVRLEMLLQVTADTTKLLAEADEEELGADLLLKVSTTIHQAISG